MFKYNKDTIISKTEIWFLILVERVIKAKKIRRTCDGTVNPLLSQI